MNYRYKKNQIFAKKLKVPKYIQNMIYNCQLNLDDYIKYDLIDKIPLECLSDFSRMLVEKYGIEKVKSVDLEILNIVKTQISLEELFSKISSDVEDLNSEIYKIAKLYLQPQFYSDMMKKECPECYFNLDEYDKNDPNYSLMSNYNYGFLYLENIIYNYSIFKEKDLSYFFKNKVKDVKLDEQKFKLLMNKYEFMFKIILSKKNIEIVNEILSLETEQQIDEYIKILAKEFIDLSIENKYFLTNEEYKELFKYVSLFSYLNEHITKITYNENITNSLISQLKSKPDDYIFDIQIPFQKLFNYGVLNLIHYYGLENIVQFDKESDNFFTKNNCEILLNMYNSYLHYSKSSFLPKTNDNNICTWEQFNEVMRNIIIYGHTNGEFPIDLKMKNIKGIFREKNDDLFISETAPEELQNMFYGKLITPSFISEHPEYIEYLKNKNLQRYFENVVVKLELENGTIKSQNLYNFLQDKFGNEKILSFIIEYSDILSLLFKVKGYDSYISKLNIMENDTLDQVVDKIAILFRNVVVEHHEIIPNNVPQKVKKICTTIFLNDNAPEELKTLFYSHKMCPSILRQHPEYKAYLMYKEPDLIFNVPVTIEVENAEYKYFTKDSVLSSLFVKQYGYEEYFKFLQNYGVVIEDISNRGEFDSFNKIQNTQLYDFYDELDKFIYEKICAGKCKYDSSISKQFQKKYPSLFISDNVPIKEIFYSRSLTLDDLNKNPQWLTYFENTNIACAFSEDVAWVIPLFTTLGNIKKENYNRLKIITAYLRIEDISLRQVFKEYISECGENIDMENIKYVEQVILRLSQSNSIEMYTFRKELATQILKTDGPIENLNKIEEIFIKNNLPVVGKVYSCFEILHPNFNSLISCYSSPNLIKKSDTARKITIFSDLIKTSFGSNNRSVNEYLKNIEIGSGLYESIKNGEIIFEQLNDEQKKELVIFVKHLATLYNNTLKGKSESFKYTENVVSDIFELSKLLSPNGTLEYNLADRVISMFCHFAGIDTLEQAKEYVKTKIKLAETRNINASKSEMVLQQGDFVKGIGDIKYLRNILQNGSVSKEYLGASADSDATPLDTDVSIILDSVGTNQYKISKTAANSYGPIWFVLKNDDRFITTRRSIGDDLYKQSDMSKLEVFYTGAVGNDHYGIRTGFASSEINYIVMHTYDPKVGIEIAMNGFYIPVADTSGKIIFTYEDYKKIREKMSGLSYYDQTDYIFSDNLITRETEYISTSVDDNEVKKKQIKINNLIKKSLNEIGLQLKTTIDGDLTEGFVELIDTGSTGRGTNLPGDGDFDYMMRIDKNILTNPLKLEQLKNVLLKNFGSEHSSEVIATGDFRLKNVQIDEETIVDIDITFTEKTDKVLYSTDMCLQDRLSSIKKIDPEKYKYVIANIIKAKQFLKQHNIYKPNRGEVPQGGLGGVGVENWILQHGGSFVDAAKSFVEASQDKTFEEFISSYFVWDFGENHMAEKRGQYVHDNFVSCNMNKDGYEKMKFVLIEYLNSLNYTIESGFKIIG